MKGWNGISFPFRFSNGKVATSKAIIGQSNMRHIDEALYHILGTEQGERVLKPKFGIKWRSMVFSSFDEGLLPYYRQMISESILESDERFSEVEIDFDKNKLDEGIVVIRIYWTLNDLVTKGETSYGFEIQK